jgi:hypothetical protein
MAVMKRMVLSTRMERSVDQFTSHTGDVGLIEFRSEDNDVKWCILIAQGAVTPANFYTFTEGDAIPLMSLLISQTTLLAYMLTVAATTWVELGDLT